MKIWDRPFRCETCAREATGAEHKSGGVALQYYGCALAAEAEAQKREHVPEDAIENLPPVGYRLLKIGETVEPGDIAKKTGGAWVAVPITAMGSRVIRTMADARAYARPLDV